MLWITNQPVPISYRASSRGCRVAGYVRNSELDSDVEGKWCAVLSSLAGGSHQVQMALKQSVVFSALLLPQRSKCSTSQWLPAQEGLPGVEPCAAPTGCLVTSLETDAG